jgi:hypothetical protein
MANFARETVTNRSFTRLMRLYGGAIVLLVMMQTMPSTTQADDQPRTDEQEAIRRMNQQIQELQAKVKELEARLNTTAGAAPHITGETNATAPAPVEVTQPAPVPPPVAQEPQDNNPAPRVNLHLFGDFGYQASGQKDVTNSFYIGSVDLFMTGALTQRVSVLGELLFIPNMDNSFSVDVERLLLQYKQNDYFNFSMGRYHSAIGYYNTAFHQGAWFQTTIDRPFMYAFDDQGGFLPLQQVGMTVSGQIPSGGLELNYVAELSNGSEHLLGVEPVQNYRDHDNGKAINFALYSRPLRLPGLEAGASIYHDQLTYVNNRDYDELISTAYVVYTSSNYEFLNEAMLVRHSGTNLAPPGVFYTPGFYTQFSRRFGKYRPYYRYSYVNAGVAEPIYGNPADGPVVGRRNGSSFGLRFDMNDHSAFKLQYDHLAQRGIPDYNQIVAQFSFAF